MLIELRGTEFNQRINLFRGLGRFNRGLVLIGFRTTGACTVEHYYPGDDSHVKRTGVLVGNFKKDPQGVPRSCREDVIDHRSYVHNLSTCEVKA